MTNKEKISVVWFKRDLRLNDNETIKNAIESNKRVLFIYVFEKILLNDPHYSERHWNFVKQSLADINKNLKEYNTKVLVIDSTIFAVFNQLSNFYKITNVFSHQETGLTTTFNRNKEFDRYCRNNEIIWTENKKNGISNDTLTIKNWMEKWERHLQLPIIKFSGDPSLFIPIDDINKLTKYFNITDLKTLQKEEFQKGGTSTGWKYAELFFNTKRANKSINSLTDNSRLSPYISWGNISVREIFQKALSEREKAYDKRLINNFLSKIRWQANFNEKFKKEAVMVNANINKGLQKLKSNISEEYINAWKEGQTGFPLVDASMRCLNETGYLDFRKRTILISFFTNILWQPWQAATLHLSKMFLDFDPSIHFTQLKTQSNNTIISLSKIYTLTKNDSNDDLDLHFIIKWIPELNKLPNRFIKKPYLMTYLDEKMNNFIPGEKYTLPIVKIDQIKSK